ncbi:MAG TPA: GGDEF domain-containing protein, partial [Bacillota bacterium]|nr:GGDEF domain-containing protein [Bacillota bacterium]
DNIYTLSSIDAKHLSALEDLCNFVGIIIENMRLFDNIEKIGQTDFLTGIYNRRVGIELINKLIENTNESLNPFTLCYVDLNGLKIVNDTKGHNVGDQMIRDLVDLMKSVVRPGDILSRIGGDEFIILFPDCKMEGAEAAWQRILDEMEVFNKGEDKPYRLRASHGIAVYNPDSNMTATRLLAIADKRMYKEKTRMNART